MYALNVRALSYIGQTLMDMKNLISNTTILTGDLNTPLSQKDRSGRQKISKEVAELNQILEQQDLVNIQESFTKPLLNIQFFQLRMGHF